MERDGKLKMSPTVWMFQEGIELREWLYFVKSFIPSKISVDTLTGCARGRLEKIVS